MNETQMLVSISDWINIFATISSLIVSVVAIIISYKSLKLTRKSIEDANKPYVHMYVETIDSVAFQNNLVIKNFGKTSAKIINLNFHTDLDKFNSEFQLSSLINAEIAPGQKFTTVLDPSFKEVISVTLTIADNKGDITSKLFTIKTDAASRLLWSTPEKSKDTSESKAIRDAAIGIIKTLK